MENAPVVKWSGSKRSQAKTIVERMPREIDTYFEPFCGGCSVLYCLLQTPDIKVKRYVCSDINASLIALWQMIKHAPHELAERYEKMWSAFNTDPFRDTALYEWSRSERYAHRKAFFADVRKRFNETHSPFDFLFIMRTTTNGMPRFNDKGDFNNSCHFSRPGINPHTLWDICIEWSKLLNEKEVEFLCQSYEVIRPGANDLLYLDPPYAATKGMYQGGIDLQSFFLWLGGLDTRWLLSFDGMAGENNYTFNVETHIRCQHEYLVNGNSSFRRVIGKNRHALVRESLYRNF